MAFGPIMQLKIGQLDIELAPIAREDLAAFVSPGMQRASIHKYLARATAPTLEDEQQWYDKTRAATDSLVWGIWDVSGGQRVLIGNTALTDITREHTIQATSGSMIFRKEYWGRGIASAIHKARTWYAFQYTGLTRIKAAVQHGNIASLKALQKSGYALVYVERNTKFIDGQLRHQDNVECLNPSELAWQLWWGDDQATVEAEVARQRTLEAMAWAEENVTLL